MQAVGDRQWLQLAVEFVQRGVCVGGRVLGTVGEGGCGCAGWGVGAADLGEELLVVGVGGVLKGLLTELSLACESAKGGIVSVHAHGAQGCSRGAQWGIVPVVAERGPRGDTAVLVAVVVPAVL